MKTTVAESDLDTVRATALPAHKDPTKPNFFFRTLVRVLSQFGLMGTKFHYETEGMEAIGKDEPCLILMNHSCFLDLMMASKIFYPRPYTIVCTADGFVGMGGLMEKLMRAIGCFPTRKFVTDLSLVTDITHCLKDLKCSVLMYPEASYSFDGTATALPRKMGVLLKRFDVPVVMVRTFGAFSRNPLYNELQVRKSVPISAKVSCLFTREDLKTKTVQELSDELDEAFTFDHFTWQQEQKLEITDPFRADGLHRILYKCPHCQTEGAMEGRGIKLRCNACSKSYTLTPLGQLEADTGDTEIPHIPDWYAWERSEVRRELESGQYRLETDVDIAMLADYKAIYKVGSGHLHHGTDGFHLTGCNGKLDYTQSPTACYGLYADYYWYEIGDMVCIGNNEQTYYCFPKDNTPVAKVRLAQEELYKLKKHRRRSTEAGQ